MTFVGFDLHKRYITACALDEAGQLVVERRQLATTLDAVLGSRDPFETAALRDGYLAKARQAGDSVDVVTIPNAGHFEVIAPSTSAWPTVLDRILGLVGLKP